MINLCKKGLPASVVVGSEPFPIKTDFRVWVEFSRCVKVVMQGGSVDLSFVFASRVPDDIQSAFMQCMDFFTNVNPLPIASGSGTVIPYDYDIDSDYIYAAFMQQYGIDLIDTDLHWHKFKALFDSITEPCKLAGIISCRCYSGNDKDMIKQRFAWSITSIRSKDDYSSELEKALSNGGDVTALL